MTNRILVTHAVLHCDEHTSDKIWAGVVLAVPGEPAQTHVMYGRRGGTMNVGTKTFAATPDALRHFDAKMTEKLTRHDYRRCDWHGARYAVRWDLLHHFPELRAVSALVGEGPTTRPVAYASLPRPGTPVAYPAGIYEVDQETRWWYVVPEDVPYGYALSPNAMLVERGDHRVRGHAADDAQLLPTWVWRATKRSAALLAPKTHVWHPAEDRRLLDRVQLELIAAVLA